MTIKIDGKGTEVSDLAKNQEEQWDRIKAQIGEDLSQSPQTPQGQFVGINSGSLTEVGEAFVASEQAGSLNHVKGPQIDSYGSLLDIKRRLATRSRVTVTLTGVAGVGIPAGSRAKTDPGGAEFRTVSPVVLSPSGATAEMEAVELGVIGATAGTLTSIVTVIAGWETITNTDDADVGVSRQEDDEYRQSYMLRTAHSSIGALPALKAALEEAMAGGTKVEENNSNAAIIVQEWEIAPSSILVIAESGINSDIRRAVENHRGMGVRTNVAINGGVPDNSALDAISNGTVTWNGVDYTGLDLTSSATPALKAAALTTLLEGTLTLPATGVTIRYIDGRYVAIFSWFPTRSPMFGHAAVEEAFGLDPDNSDYPVGPFIRPKNRDLTIVVDVTRRAGFPGDGLAQIRDNLAARVKAYDIGEEVWLNDLLCEVERVGGTRITAMTVQYDSADISGVAVPLDIIWSLPAANLTINIA